MPERKPAEIVQEAPIPSIYTNTTRMMFGVFDFRIVFSENMMRGDFSFVQVDRVAVVMSPQHMKRLIKTVSEKLAEYEEKFGPIPQDPVTDSDEATLEIEE